MDRISLQSNKIKKTPSKLKSLLALFLFSCSTLNAAENKNFRKVGGYLIPAMFSEALSLGMSVPLYIRYKEEGRGTDNRKIADVMLSLDDEGIIIRDVSLSEMKNKTELSAETKNLIGSLTNEHFSDNFSIKVSKDAEIFLNVKTFNIELVVSKEALTAAIIPRSELLGESTSVGLSSILNYDIGSYYNATGSRSYITLDDITSFKENHININGAIYGVGTDDVSGNLYRAMFERDVSGRRFAIGMIDTWNLQSIASLNTLNSSRIYGASYGNKASTKLENNSLSLTPITVFLPAAGEVHILRDGRLLSIQKFEMGSFEIDTKKLPYGVYDVTVEVVTNGRLVSSRNARINKAFSRKSSSVNELAWQLFGGTMEYSRAHYKNHHYYSDGKVNTWLTGVSSAISFPLLSGLALKSSAYGFDQNIVNETDLSLTVNEYINISTQTMLANDSSWRNISTLNLSDRSGYGSIWLNREKSKIGDNLPATESDNYSYGGTFNLNKIVNHAGSFTVSITDNKYTGNKYTNFDYSTTLLANKYGTLSIRAGIQRYYYKNSSTYSNGSQDKYIAFDLSLPLASWLGFGVSNERGNALANISARKHFNDSVITSSSASLSKSIGGGTAKSDYSSSGSLSYDTKYNGGTVSLTNNSSNQKNVSLSSHGSIAWSGRDFGLSKDKQKSGIIVDTGIKNGGSVAAKVNGRSYKMDGKSNFIALPPYAKYSIEIMNDKLSEDSFDIASGRNQTVTLYPGNINVIKPEIKKMVTVFGVIKLESGNIAKNMDIHNHIGKAKTNDKGEFSMDIDRSFPVITMINSSGGLCEVDLNLENARGAVWLGELQCEKSQQLANTR